MNILLNGLPFVDGMMDHAKEQAKAHIQAQIMDWIGAGLDVLQDLSFTIALIGGGICIIVYAVTGIKRAGKAFGIMVLAHAIIRYLIGGAS